MLRRLGKSYYNTNVIIYWYFIVVFSFCNRSHRCIILTLQYSNRTTNSPPSIENLIELEADVEEISNDYTTYFRNPNSPLSTVGQDVYCVICTLCTYVVEMVVSKGTRLINISVTRHINHSTMPGLYFYYT